MKHVFQLLRQMAMSLYRGKYIHDLLVSGYYETHLYRNSDYRDEKRLKRYERQVYSQNGEDGIIEEIFRRIGKTNKYFVEFGVENGLETNSTYLLLKGWSGLWLEGSSKAIKNIHRRFSRVIQNGQLTAPQAFITAENIEALFAEASVPAELDMLSIDVDRNDYYVWKAIASYSPRLVVIEYAATIPPTTSWVIDYDANKTWDGTSFSGASLKALEELGREKGYSLVECDFTGSNAFFVRDDLVGGYFAAPFTAEHHYQPARYFLKTKWGHPRHFA